MTGQVTPQAVSKHAPLRSRRVVLGVTAWWGVALLACDAGQRQCGDTPLSPCPEEDRGTIAGVVTVDAQGQSGVSVMAVPGGQATTGPSGNYSLEVPAGRVTVTVAEVAAVTFDQASLTIDVPANTVQTVNFVGRSMLSPGTGRIIGQVTVDESPRSDVPVTTSIGPSDTSGASGDYSIVVPAGTLTVSVAPVPGATFDPSSRTVTVGDRETKTVNFAGTSTATLEERIAFASDRGGNDNYDIYTMALDGTDLQRITEHDALDNSPRWSPDGERLAFHSRRQQGDRIWLMDRDGSNPELVETGGASYLPAWGLTGLAYASRDGNRDIYTFDLSGTAELRITSTPGEDTAPDWHTSRKEIVFQSERTGNFEIYVVAEAGGPARAITERGLHTVNPRWSPDGSQIAFASELGNGGAMEIFIAEADGSNPRQLTTLGDRSRHPAWSPDGGLIAFQSRPITGGDWEIYVVDLGTEGVTQLTNNDAEDEDPDWAEVPGRP